MKSKTIEVHICDFCNKLYQRKRFAEEHEVMCTKNPANDRPCFSCIHLDKKLGTVTKDHYDGSQSDYEVNCFYCKAKEHFLYTPQNEMKENFFDLGDDLNEPMPKDCDIFNDQSIDFDHLDYFLQL